LSDTAEYADSEVPTSSPQSPSPLRGDALAAAIALLCFALIVFFAKSSESTLPATDAAAHAAYAMSATSHGLVSQYPANLPATYFALTGWVMRLLGPSTWVAKLVPGLFSVGTVMMTFTLGRTLRSNVLGIVAAIILALSRDFIRDGLNAHLDGVMLFFILASFVFWERGKYMLAGVAAGLGIWFKSPVALILYPTMLIVHLLRLDVFKKMKPWLISLAIALGVGALVWILTGLFGGWDIVRDYWVSFFSATPIPAEVQHSFDPFMFLDVLRGSYLPWSVFLAVGIVWSIVFFRFRRAEFVVPLSAAAIMIVGISCLRVKYPHYFVPAYPFMALIAAQPLTYWLEKKESDFYRGFMVLTMLGATAILVSPIQLAPESFPALRRFIPYIQAAGGDEHDEVVMVEGGQPYGHFNDYANLIRFYTGKTTKLADCQTVNLAAQRREVKWILIFGKNYSSCLDDSVRRSFSKEIIDGDQHLLARPGMISSGDGGKTDLTPLNQDLKH
jgi:4-amino-4-deoxy-L-arabinose transferase-like glycosyltransferase